MDSLTYIAGATKTESVPASLEMNELAFHAIMDLAIHTAKIVDLVKRKLYYGADMPTEKLGESLAMVHQLSRYLGEGLANSADINVRLAPGGLADAELPEEMKVMNLDNIDKRLLHCALGCFTESAELIEAMQAQYTTGIIDRTNIQEEFGDLQWYIAIGCDATNADMDALRDTNIAKLKKRFPDKFDAAKALNRDLKAERTILEEGPVA